MNTAVQADVRGCAFVGNEVTLFGDLAGGDVTVAADSPCLAGPAVGRSAPAAKDVAPR